MSENYIRNVIEAALLAAGRPLQIAELAQLFDEPARPATEELQAALAALAAEYEHRGIEIRETASGYRIQVRAVLANEVSRLWPERPPRYSRALLETLALIAYRQPITRGEIEAVRGVAVNPNILKTLLERNWIRVVGHRDVPGRPELLGTTRDFLDYFGLKSLDELPPLAALKAMTDPNLTLDLPATPVAVAAGEGAAGEAVADIASGAVAGEPGAGVQPAEVVPVLVETVAEALAVENLAGADDDGSDDDELSASGEEPPQGLVAAPPDPDR
jgi:segregation and condensation protein B